MPKGLSMAAFQLPIDGYMSITVHTLRVECEWEAPLLTLELGESESWVWVRSTLSPSLLPHYRVGWEWGLPPIWHWELSMSKGHSLSLPPTPPLTLQKHLERVNTSLHCSQQVHVWSKGRGLYINVCFSKWWRRSTKDSQFLYLLYILVTKFEDDSESRTHTYSHTVYVALLIQVCTA